MELPSKAENVARVKHYGQFDKVGEHHIWHVERVVAGVPDSAKCVAWLHDVIEDTNLELEDLTLMGFPPMVICNVDALTRRPNDESYWQYIERIKRAGLPVAVTVKVADLKDHLSRRRNIPKSLARRYLEALRFLGSDNREEAIRLCNQWNAAEWK